ncbi:MAG TPA: hypothetical protein VJA21_04040, partial [Verrucomicrobiae bacterium]
MITLLLKLVRYPRLLCLSAWALAPLAFAQGAELGIQTYAGLSITGAVGTVYSIEYSTDLPQTNDWRSLAFLRLPAPNYLWV